MIQDLTGRKFGKLTAICPLAERTSHGSAIWECRCDCGAISHVCAGDLASQHTKSCGCLRYEAPEEHKDGVLLSHLFSTAARKGNKSGFRGVTVTRSGKFQARIYLGGKRHHLGTFDTAMQAHDKYLKVKERLHYPLLRKYNYKHLFLKGE